MMTQPTDWVYVLGGIALVVVLYQVQPYLGGLALVILVLGLWMTAKQKGVLLQ